MKQHVSLSASSLSLAIVAVVLSGVILLLVNAEGADDEESRLGRPQRHPQDESMMIFHFDTLSSTQDEARRIAEEGVTNEAEDQQCSNDVPMRSFVVTTREQTNGRGTNGRMWMGQRGNVFCTIGIRQEDWMKSGIPLTLLPLKIGSLVAQQVQTLLEACRGAPANGSQMPLVTVKWPNDVLVDEKKISGVLIKSSSNGWFLIGIGINLAYAPPVTSPGPNRGRPSTSIADWCVPDQNPEITAERVGIEIALELHQFLVQASEGTSVGLSERILREWKQWIDWDMELVMRDTAEQERVKMVDVLADGRVQVQNVDNGRTRTLVSDYFL